MDYIEQESFYVMGIEARTNNSLEAGPNGIIPKQWEKFISQKLAELIPDSVSQMVIAGYTDYESDVTGDYTFFLGVKVKSTKSIPEGMVVKKVPAGKFKIFTSDEGPVWETVPSIWKKIWATKLNRSYQFDYEVYDGRSVVDVYIGIN